MRLRSRRLGFNEGFGGRPMALRLAFGASFVEPQEIGDLTDPIVAVSHFRLRLKLVGGRFRLRGGGLLATANEDMETSLERCRPVNSI